MSLLDDFSVMPELVQVRFHARQTLQLSFHALSLQKTELVVKFQKALSFWAPRCTKLTVLTIQPST